MNLIPAKVEVENGSIFAETLDHSGSNVRLRFTHLGQSLKEYEGREIILGIRPEAITDRESADRNSSGMESIQNLVAVTEPAGSDTYVTSTLGGRDTIARMRADAGVQPGQLMEFLINMEKAIPFDPKTELRIA